MPWYAQLDLDYNLEADRCVARHLHTGPLRILQSLYPEGDAVCHNVLVHPPGGLVGGDTLDIRVGVREGAHGLITTPGATRFYRSDGEAARQHARLTVETGARLEWLPLETLCYNACVAENRLDMTIHPGGELMGWDLTALGLPAASLPFERGSFCQHIEAPGVWLERARISAADGLLMNGPLGLAGNRCVASMFFVAGSKLGRARRQVALDSARAVIGVHSLASQAGATSPDAQIVVVRVLAPVVEPAMDLLRGIWAAWRRELWGMEAIRPRGWAI
ncbi:MAG: urease accessory protein UreD [Pseudomonadota bacterium]